MLKVSGASDDLIEIEGKSLSEEFSYDGRDRDDEKGAYLAFSDGTLLSVTYDRDGIWRFGVISKGSSFISKNECVGDGDKTYSDEIFMGEDMKWVMYGSELVKAKR